MGFFNNNDKKLDALIAAVADLKDQSEVQSAKMINLTINVREINSKIDELLEEHAHTVNHQLAVTKNGTSK